MKVDWGEHNFYISKLLAANLDNFVKGVMDKNTSAVFIVDGRSGLGKTTKSSQVGCYINNRVKEWYKKKGKGEVPPEFTLDSMAWTPQEFIEKFEHVKKGSIVIMDESMIISNRSAMSEVNKSVVIMMSMIRSKNVFVIFNVNSIFDLDKNLAMHRADMLINLYPKGGKFASRGAYQVIPSAQGKLKYLYITGKKYYDYSKARKAFNDTFSSFFPFDEVEYERRKQEAINSYFEQGTKKETARAITSRDKYIKYLTNDPNLTKDDIARLGGISVRTVYRSLQEG